MKRLMPTYDRYGVYRTGPETITAGGTHPCREEHRSFKIIFLLENSLLTGRRSQAYTFLGIMFTGIA